MSDQTRTSILSWVSAGDPKTTQENIYSHLTPGTGTWLFENPMFRDWVVGKHAILFCPGIPGAGKTCLASQVVHHLQTTKMPGSTPLVAWIYCDYNDKASQSVSRFLGSLLRQILDCVPNVPDSVHDLYYKHGKGQSPMTLAETISTIQDVLKSRPRSFLIIDALDECTELHDTRESLVKELIALTPTVSLLATSRPIVSIERLFDGDPKIRLSPDRADVEKYVEQRLASENKLKRILQADEALGQLIKDTLVDKSDGMHVPSQYK